jgi:polysaccharide export outer membrane protein
MKTANLLITAFFVPALMTLAQDKAATPEAVSAPAASTSAPTTVAAPLPAVASVAPDNSYVIGPTDVLSVTVWKEPTLSGTYLVRPDGMISVPLLGDLLANGLTAAQLTEQISARLKKFMQDPTVTVILTGINSKKIYMLGEVGRKGPLDMTPGMTLLQAIGTAGGLNDFANTKKIYILRVEGGAQQKIFVHYKQAVKGDLSANIALKPGDTIVVP